MTNCTLGIADCPVFSRRGQVGTPLAAAVTPVVRKDCAARGRSHRAMDEPRAQRTLVKSPPELWAEVSDPGALAGHLGAFGEIRITRLEPESTVAWEGDRARGTVELEPSGWGTRVTLTARIEEARRQSEPPAPATAAPRQPAGPEAAPTERHPGPAPTAHDAEPAPAPRDPEPAPGPPARAPGRAPAPRAPEPAPGPPAPRRGLLARLFGRRRRAPEAPAERPEPEPEVEAEAEAEAKVATPPADAPAATPAPDHPAP